MTSDQKTDELPKSKCKQELLALHDSLEVLGGKWKLQILVYLTNRKDQENNFTRIKRGIDGISAKMLVKELRDLETNLLITRVVQNSKPQTVTYSITEYGQNVLPVTNTLLNWGLVHREKIKKTLG
ncbi:winged helix-turn-helix transcriptional regulator [Dyadobacter diqingensis]|uniref:winged helix-turn-helix transcriptional regulator n=1 Tax=Dyadobacter diqingensis TaxID=2938121 RepID=UPI0020C27264|nr:helix-turn-helix domain-containing protein [Dyadobacter diqingensis]